MVEKRNKLIFALVNPIVISKNKQVRTYQKTAYLKKKEFNVKIS